MKLAANDVVVPGINVASYGPVTLSGFGTTYTITLAEPISNAYRVTVAISNASAFSLTHRLDVLPSNVTDDGMVDNADLSAERNAVVAPAP